jgi:hypothetical protein
MGWPKKVGLGVVVVIAAAQLVRPARTNPHTDEAQTLRAQIGGASELPAIVDRACGDCHSNESRWPWYTRVAPLSWIMVRGVDEGRKIVNFSEWGSYSPQQRHMLLAASCVDATQGRMPVSAYTWFHPEARLSPADVETICAASR